MSHISSIQDVLDYIEDNLDEDLDISILSEVAHISPYHFHRIFKKVTKESLIKYIQKRRLTHAALKLVATDKPIIEIAFNYNYNSQEAFSRSFKKQFKESPLAYRQKKWIDTKSTKSKIDLNIFTNTDIEYSFETLPSIKLIGILLKGSYVDGEKTYAEPIKDSPNTLI